MNSPDAGEVYVKEKRLFEYMEEKDYDAVIIGRQDNFAWLTCGGCSGVLLNSEYGVSIIVITRDSKYVIANTMDGQRIIDEEMEGLGYELVNLKWYERSKEGTALELVKGMRVVSDIALEGIDYRPAEFTRLHYPLTAKEIENYRWLAAKTEEVVRKVSDCVKPGMSEREAEAMLVSEFAFYGIRCVVLITGSDHRIGKYRHCITSDKKIERILMLAPAVQKRGLTVPLTRMVYFGDKLPEEIQRKYEAVCVIEASTFFNCIPGKKFADILKIQKNIYKKTGFPDEWRNHFQGGITGYIVNDPTQCMNSEAKIVFNQTFNWYITITGVKVEETVITGSSGIEILTSNGLWPVKEYDVCGRVFKLPRILMK